MEPITPNPQLIAETQANNRLLSDTVSSIGRFGLAAVGVGASTRLLQEVLAANRAAKQRKDLNLVSIPTGMKMAQAAVPAPAPALPGSAVADLNPLGRPLYRDPLNPGEQYRALGHRASSPLEIPWAWPAAGAAVAVGGLGAYSLLDNLLNARRKKDLKDEVDEAKGEFESALTGSVPGQMKTAALQELSNRYAAAVSDKPVKKADWLGAGQGIYAGGLLAALGIGGMYGWQQAAKSDPTRVRAELARRRAARRLATEPVEVELEPTGTPVKMAAGIFDPHLASETPDERFNRYLATGAVSTGLAGVLGGGIGSVAGSLSASPGHRGRGAVRGAGIGAGIGAGAQLGGIVGGTMGALTGSRYAALAGMLAGTGLGGYAGYHGGRSLVGRTPPEPKPPVQQVEQPPVDLSGIDIEQLRRLLAQLPKQSTPTNSIAA